ncbi:hypothetical protein, partial [Escherichia coli]|uniref:hypothetical protein n=1 Tax=Escherichia coli TaxID=562 RepID=UPI003F1E07CF
WTINRVHLFRILFTNTVLTIQQPDIKHSTNTLLTLSPTPDIFPNPIVYEKRFNADKLILYG